MIVLSLVGIGTGNPQHLTLQAIEALNACDVILIPRKGAKKDDLAEARRQICAQVLRPDGPGIVEFDLPVRDAANPSYRAGVDDWHDAIADTWAHEIKAAVPGRGRIGFLVWGDPSLYDSTLRITERLKDKMDVTLEVTPGITSVQALTASHRITLNEIGAPVLITTGRMLRKKGWPQDADTVVVLLDGDCAFQTLDRTDLHIWWSAYAGMPQEINVSGPLPDVTDEIINKRAKARETNGWVMDIYLLRRTNKSPEHGT